MNHDEMRRHAEVCAKIPVDRNIAEEEKEVAADIFATYCDFRRTKGLLVPDWDPDLAGLAFVAACRTAKLNNLKHRTGFTYEQSLKYSDILQYSTWKMSGEEAVSRWAGSAGHRKMMQCETTKKAGVGAYKTPDGAWFYAIVYDFCGCNQGGE